jgi:hypothetical protein
MHFVTANQEERAVNEALFDAIEEGMTSTEDQDAKLMEVRGLLRRIIQRPQPPPTQEQLITIRSAKFTIRQLLVTIPAHRWPSLEFDFPCPNPHCHWDGDATVEHLQDHRDQYSDGLFHDPLIATLAGLMGCRLDMTDGAGFVCPFHGQGCTFRAETLTYLKAHLDGEHDPRRRRITKP